MHVCLSKVSSLIFAYYFKFLHVTLSPAGTDFPQYYGVVIFKMPRFHGIRVKSFRDLNRSQAHQVFGIVKKFHEVNIE